MTSANAELVELGDLDELTRHVERLCAARDWDGLVDLRDRCRRALERGKQLWPVASHAEYRLALEAPATYAAAVVEPGAGQFALGPLAEVAASTHPWADLAPHLPPGPLAAVVAHERVVRGEDLRADDRIDRNVLDLPLVLQPWEPTYPVATYRADRAEFGDVPMPARLLAVELHTESALLVVDDGETVAALTELAGAWTAQSNGTARAVCVEGGAPAAIAALGVEAARFAAVEPAPALAYMAWTAASGGAHGRRRGMAQGRFSAWWAAAALTGLLDGWPVAPDELGDAVAALRWYRWDPGPVTGWSLRLAVEDPHDGLAWAVEATDHR